MTKKKIDRQGTSQAVNERIISQTLSEHVKVTDSCMKREREAVYRAMRICAKAGIPKEIYVDMPPSSN